MRSRDPKSGLPWRGRVWHAEGLTCKVKEGLAGACWHSEQPSRRSGVSGSSAGAGSGGAGVGPGMAAASRVWHSFSCSTRSQQVTSPGGAGGSPVSRARAFLLAPSRHETRKTILKTEMPAGYSGASLSRGCHSSSQTPGRPGHRRSAPGASPQDPLTMPRRVPSAADGQMPPLPTLRRPFLLRVQVIVSKVITACCLGTENGFILCLL